MEKQRFGALLRWTLGWLALLVMGLFFSHPRIRFGSHFHGELGHQKIGGGGFGALHGGWPFLVFGR